MDISGFALKPFKCYSHKYRVTVGAGQFCEDDRDENALKKFSSTCDVCVTYKVLALDLREEKVGSRLTSPRARVQFVFGLADRRSFNIHCTLAKPSCAKRRRPCRQTD